jgi:hypothetical protein
VADLDRSDHVSVLMMTDGQRAHGSDGAVALDRRARSPRGMLVAFVRSELEEKTVRCCSVLRT